MCRPTAPWWRRRVRGLVAQVLVDHNQPVTRGQPLVRIDPEEFDARVASATADLATAQAAVQSAQAAFVTQAADEKLAASNVRAARTAITSSQAQDVRAQADRQRYDALVASGAVARRDADQFRAAAISAASDAQHSQAELSVSQSQAADVAARRATLTPALAQAQAGVARAKAALDLALQDQAHTLVRAPIDGVVGDRQVAGGRLCAAGDAADDHRAPQRPLCDGQFQGDPGGADAGRPERGGPGRRPAGAALQGLRRQPGARLRLPVLPAALRAGNRQLHQDRPAGARAHRPGARAGGAGSASAGAFDDGDSEAESAGYGTVSAR